MIPAGIGKRIPRTDPVGIANDDDISKICHSLFSIPTIPLVCDKVEDMSGVWASMYVHMGRLGMYILADEKVCYPDIYNSLTTSILEMI